MVTSTNSTASTQSIVSALGAGSGIDMAALANDLAVAQFAGRSARLASRSEKLDTQISDAATIKSMLANLTASLGERLRAGDLSAQPSVANAAVASASLSGTRQPSGSYGLEVTKLATGQTLACAPYASATDMVGAGTLTLRFGTVSGGGFTADSAQAAVDITIASGATLGDVASAINKAGAGVTAYVAQTVDGAQLVLKGKEGAVNGFVIEAAEDAGNLGLANLAWAPGSSGATLVAGAGNAELMIDGLAVTSASNTLTNAIPGVTLKLTATNAGAATRVTFGNPAEAITEAMADLTAALNEVMFALNTATDPLSGSLRSDSGARALKRTMSGLAGSTIMPTGAGAARTLADLGLSTQRDGTFALDTARLAQTLAKDPDGVVAMFTTGLDGIYATFDKITRSASSATDPGSIGGSISRYTKLLQQIGEDQSELAGKQETLRASLAKRFAVSDNRINQSQATLAFLRNQIDAWNKSGD